MPLNQKGSRSPSLPPGATTMMPLGHVVCTQIWSSLPYQAGCVCACCPSPTCSLEDEALDLGGPPPSDLTSGTERDADTSELALLVADFVLLDEQLAALSDALCEGTEAMSSGSGRWVWHGVGMASLLQMSSWSIKDGDTRSDRGRWMRHDVVG